MRAVQQNPDGLVIVTLDSLAYVDTPENLALDFGQALPPLPAGADDRVYEPGIRHAIMGNGNVRDGGPMPWSLGDAILASLDKILTAQAKRRAPLPLSLDMLKQQKLEQLEAAFQQRAQAPINFPVGGSEYVWDADNEAVRNITGVVLLIATGVPIPDPRTWSPKDAQPISITHMELVGLGAAIAARKDTLFLVKKRKQLEIAALGTANQVQNYDETSGW